MDVIRPRLSCISLGFGRNKNENNCLHAAPETIDLEYHIFMPKFGFHPHRPHLELI